MRFNWNWAIALAGCVMLGGVIFLTYEDSQTQAKERTKREAEAKRRNEDLIIEQAAKAAWQVTSSDIDATMQVQEANRQRRLELQIAQQQLMEMRRANDITERAVQQRRMEALKSPTYEPPVSIRLLPVPAHDDMLQQQILRQQQQSMEDAALELRRIRELQERQEINRNLGIGY